MINSVIIDDEQHCIERLHKLLNQYCGDSVRVLGNFTTVREGLMGITELQPDLVFLDVMIGNETGFDLLKQITSVNFEVIFTTAYDKYAVEAFRFSALDFLLKPIDPDNLVEAVNKVRKKQEENITPLKLEALFHNLKNLKGSAKRISIPTVNGIDFIQVSDIMRCQSEGNYTIIFLKDKRKITVARTLKEFEDLLCEYDFFRVHNSHVVNLAFVKSYSRGKSGHVIMFDDTPVEVATRRRDEFLKKMLL